MGITRSILKLGIKKIKRKHLRKIVGGVKGIAKHKGKIKKGLRMAYDAGNVADLSFGAYGGYQLYKSKKKKK